MNWPLSTPGTVQMPFDAGHTFPHRYDGSPFGMKTILFAAFLSCAAVLSARADIVLPQPTLLTVSNLSAFPKFKFTIAMGSDEFAQPLAEKKIYQVNSSARLFVQDPDGKPRLWATVEANSLRGQAVKVLVKEVRRSSKGIEVSYDKEEGAALPSPKKSATRAADAWPQFLLAGLGCCGLVLLSRRKAAL